MPGKSRNRKLEIHGYDKYFIHALAEWLVITPVNKAIRLSIIRGSPNFPMNRLRAIFGFIFCGGLLIFVSPYLVREAAIKQLPWSIPIIVIPLYALLSYGAFKRFWPRIIGRNEMPTLSKNSHDKSSQRE